MTRDPNARSLSTTPTAHVEQIANATIAPVMRDAPLRYGVYRPDGQQPDNATTRLSAGRFSGLADLPSAVEHTLKGRYLFGGLARLHFGHFLLETIPRLWALDHITGEIDGIIFVHHPNHNLRPTFRKNYAALYSALSGGKPFHLVTDPTSVETLYVPTQGFGHGEWSKGTPEFRNYVRQKLQVQFTAKGPEKLYISRSKLKDSLPSVDQEDRIEQMMEAAGYTVFHPQHHSVQEQCEHYLAAREIVGGDGSAFHLAAFCVQPEAKVGLIQRRDRPDAYNAIHDQIQAFSEAQIFAINPLTYAARAPDTLEEPIDFERLRSALTSAGLLS